MTVVHPNHIVGINSITVQTGDSLSVHKSDGSLIRTIVSNTGVSTFHAVEVSKGGGDLTVGISTLVVDNSAGKIGIGTVPARTLQVFAATPQLNLKSASGGTCELQFGDTGDEVRANIIYNSTDNYLGFNGYNNTERFRITSAGKVGINTTSPGSPLEVNGGSALDTATFNSHHAQGVLINLQRSGTNIGFLGSGKNIADATGGVDDIGLRSQANLIFTSGGGTERLRINSSGHIVPGADSTYDLGLTGTRFRNVYADTVYGDGSNLTGVSAGVQTALQTATNAVVTLDLSKQDHKLTLAGICTVDCKGGTEGDAHTVRIINSGIATVGFSTYFLFPSGASPVLPSTNTAINQISFTVHHVGAGATQLLAGASLNYG